jgi:decaprenylphospho-beta-D-ribofuranose 2-oxidase
MASVRPCAGPGCRWPRSAMADPVTQTPARTSAAAPVPEAAARLSGWGRVDSTVARLARPGSSDLIASLLPAAGPGGVIARGLGRSYNNAAQNAGGLVVSMTGLREVLRFEPETGLLTCEAGASLEQLLTRFVPGGWFIPVSPGTRQVTVGGAIAADVHGKNHHRAGSFARHVIAFDLLTADGQVRTVTPESEPDLFWATAGGMGLTGIMLRATIQLVRVPTSQLLVDTVRTADLDETMACLAEADQCYRYTVAWTDCLARGAALGRSVVTSGNFAGLSDLPARQRASPLAFRAAALATAPPVFPGGLLNRYTVAALNQAWYRKAPRRRTGELQSIGRFFHPLDGIRQWNRVYGPPGFRQYQCVLPAAAQHVLASLLERISAARAPSFVTVLKRFGPGDEGMLSFPMPGWTLALDFPAATPGLSGLLAALDRLVLDAGGRLYLAKDSRIPPELMSAMYPKLEQFRAVRASIDPDAVFGSDLSRRLRL